MSDPHAVAIHELAKAFHTGGEPIVAVDGVTLDIAAGSVVAVTGPSGSGKSTLLHLIGAIERADAGTIEVDGVEITGLRRAKLAAYRRGIGFVFQRYHLLPALTAAAGVLIAGLAALVPAVLLRRLPLAQLLAEE